MNKLFIANPDWFTRRKYGGRGLGVANYKGWIYIGVVILLIEGLSYLGNIVHPYFTFIAYGIGVMALIETVYVVNKVYTNKLDEREKSHEQLSERNAARVIVKVLIMGVIYQSYQSSLTGNFDVDRFILIALTAGVITKGITNILLEKRN